MTNTTATFTHLSTVAIPVHDQDKSLAFYRSFGLEVRFDAELQEGFRWIELVPPGATTSIALVPAGDDLPTGIDTGIRLLTPDAKQARDEVAAAGADVGELLDWPGVPLMFSFTDLDGNRLYVTQDA
jgi:catechol 2,3-dioxygenase-like lactoylglutathione lyase family enzyme